MPDPAPIDDVWSDFVVRYDASIRRALHRVLRDREAEDEAYVRVLVKLRGALADHPSRVESPRAWVAVVSTRVAIDFHRERHGRVRWPEAVENLDPVDRRVFELCHRDGLDFRETLARLLSEGVELSVPALAAAVGRVDAALTPAARRQLARLERGRAQGRSPRQIDVLDHMIESARETSAAQSPEFQLLQREVRALHDRLRDAIDGLPTRDRELLHRYYHEGQAASEIDTAMGFGGVRRVHTALERLRRDLARALRSSEARGVVRHPSSERRPFRGGE